MVGTTVVSWAEQKAGLMADDLAASSVDLSEQNSAARKVGSLVGQWAWNSAVPTADSRAGSKAAWRAVPWVEKKADLTVES